MVPNAPKLHETHQINQFRVQWGGSGAFIAKFPTQLCGTNFCTSSARFTPSFVTQPNRPNCNEIIRNARKHQSRVQWGGSCGSSLQKVSTRLGGMNFCTSSACFAPSFVRQPNGPECSQMVRNTRKRQFKVKWGGSDAFVAKNSDATSWHELLH